ncbi:hypothetical protein B0T22DRAFT_434159 [Podospora appendiculata]|uniref:FAD-binding PCMH-type domain-containing protein n=1 Tax=Podospora appendiculata TaxID=314037 RepID=A0AAE1C7R9_9PEZI|nr:hypothetical protein B0T22DRAFT_434159 [Podospora appendiculata]
MGNQASNLTPLEKCITAVADGRDGFAGFPGRTILYQDQWVHRYNLDYEVEPVAVIRPQSAKDISGIIMCATQHNVKVQAKSGGHSYGNYGLGGEDGAIAIDLVNFQDFSMDGKTWRATIGAGTRLGDVTKKLHDHGNRAIAHGVCPDVGIGGHCTIGGLGPMSRMWGSCLDHVVEVEVVTSVGSIERASETLNPDLFWALKGAASSFGIITQFVVQTRPAPGNAIQYSYSFNFGSQAQMAPLFSAWQDLVTRPSLDRRFASEFIMTPLGAVITGTFYGSEEEFNSTGIPTSIPGGDELGFRIHDWLASLVHSAETEALYLSKIPAPFVSKSLAFRREDLLGALEVKGLFDWVDRQDKGTLLWFAIFSVQGGALADVGVNETAFAHRDKVLIFESYGVGLPVMRATREFIHNLHKNMKDAAPSGAVLGTYPGYVDPTLEEGQREYWGANLPRLERLKREWDPFDVFHNPQSVRVGPVEDGGV